MLSPARSQDYIYNLELVLNTFHAIVRCSTARTLVQNLHTFCYAAKKQTVEVGRLCPSLPVRIAPIWLSYYLVKDAGQSLLEALHIVHVWDRPEATKEGMIFSQVLGT